MNKCINTVIIRIYFRDFILMYALSSRVRYGYQAHTAIIANMMTPTLCQISFPENLKKKSRCFLIYLIPYSLHFNCILF